VDGMLAHSNSYKATVLVVRRYRFFTTFRRKVVTDLPQEGSVILLGRI
jgi:hypothetical protein